MRLVLLGLAAGLLLLAPVTAATAASPADLKSAVVRSMSILDQSQPVWSKQATCASCHHQTQPLALAAIARSKGVAVNEPIAAQRLQTVLKELQLRKEPLQSHGFMPGGHTVIAALLVGALDAGAPPSEITDDAVLYLIGKQSSAGLWESAAMRFPNGGTDFFSTSLAVRALDHYAPPSLRREADQRIARARSWMVSAAAPDADGRAHRLNGLVWAKAPRAAVAKAVADIAADQKADGGWSQKPDYAADAYMTALTLNALARSGMKPSDSVYDRGVQYLLKTQAADGSWFVKARALPIQPTIDGGFPYGTDQWISATATVLGAAALAYALP